MKFPKRQNHKTLLINDDKDTRPVIAKIALKSFANPVLHFTQTMPQINAAYRLVGL